MKKPFYTKQIALHILFGILITLTVCQRAVEPSLSDEVVGVYDVASWCTVNDTVSGVYYSKRCQGTYQAVLLVKKIDADQVRITARRYGMYKDEYLYFNRFSLRDQDEYKMILLDSMGTPIGNFFKIDPRLLFTTRDQKGREYYMIGQKRPN